MNVLVFLASFLFLLTLPGVSASLLRHRTRRQGLPYVNQWEDKVLRYYYVDGFPFEFKAMFRDAFEYISSRTCLRFEENKNADHKLAIEYHRSKCESMFGRKNWDEQYMYFSHTCATFGVAVHELMHALGIAHAQARSDRDKYLVVDSTDYNDDKEEWTFNPVPFDYGSVMLYTRDETKYPKDPEYNYTMGSVRVAFYDMILLNEYYECKCDKKFEKLECQHGGYQNPAKCDECICTDGFKGKLCDEIIEDIKYAASTEWKSGALYIVQKKGSENENTMPLTRYVVITAPPNSTIEVKLTKLDGFFCHLNCDFNGVEVKYKTDRRITSPTFCCNNDNMWNVTRSSTNNPLVIAKYGMERGPVLEFNYRYVPSNQTTKADNGTTNNSIN